MKEITVKTRKQKSLINIATALFSNVVLTIISFFTSRIIRDKLGLEVLGLNGVLGNIISILSLTELGIGTAITFALYKPLAENDVNSLKAIMNFYKKAYRVVAFTVLVIGLVILPFTKVIVKTDAFDAKFIYTAFIFFLGNSVLSYLLIYKRTIIVADQKNYIVTTSTLVYSTVLKIAQLLVVIFTNNYFLYLSVNILCTLLINLYISAVANKLYPFLKEKNPPKLESETQKMIVTKIKALFLHSIGTVIVFSTDNILVSYFSGISNAGRYTSYVVIVNMVGTFIELIFQNLHDSIGNFLVENNETAKYDLFKKLDYLCHSLVFVCAVCLLILIPPFMKIWLGEDIILDSKIMYALIISFILGRNRNAVGNMKSAAGLYEQDKWAPLVEGFINLVASIILGKIYGILGVVLGTIISSIVIPCTVQPIVIYKHIFKRNVSFYFLNYIKDFAIFAGIHFVAKYVSHLIFDFANLKLLPFLGVAAFVFVLSLLLWLAINSYSKEERYYISLGRNKLRRVKK